ncbi:MAG: hypothetical protein ACRDQZ_00125 [Mycobacteriales bacterium]
MWDSTDYELDWPRELLRGELLALCNHPHRSWSASDVELMLTEAFHTDVPAADFGRVSALDGWVEGSSDGLNWVNDLLAHLNEVREYRPPRPYWSARHGAPPDGPRRTVGQLRVAVAQLISSLQAEGYLDRALPKVCVDDRDGVEPDPEALLADRLGVPGLWPLQPEAWDTDTFYGLIEVFHDLVARPRSRSRHEFNDCGLHFGDFDTDAGRRVYRALVNRLLAENAVELRLADDGEDAGRLVHVVDEARGELVERVLATQDTDIVKRVEHAIALFRRRDASTEDKRLAVVALTGILERRLPVIKQTPLLTEKDEGALFNIANNFDLRHQDIKQQREYDPAFLDWIFWWYLATIELTNQIIARQDTSASETA